MDHVHPQRRAVSRIEPDGAVGRNRPNAGHCRFPLSAEPDSTEQNSHGTNSGDDISGHTLSDRMLDAPAATSTRIIHPDRNNSQ